MKSPFPKLYEQLITALLIHLMTCIWWEVAAKALDNHPNYMASEAIGICPAAVLELKLEPGKYRVLYTISGITLHLSLGTHKVITETSNNTVCNTTINVTEGTVVCPPDVTYVTSGSANVGTSWNLPIFEGIEQNDIRCLSCPPNTQVLHEGAHLIEYKYIYVPTSHAIGCSFQVVVVSQSGTPSCGDDVTLLLQDGETTASFNIQIFNGKTIPVNFPAGVHSIDMISKTGSPCSQIVKVIELNKPISREVYLELTYPLPCSKLGPISRIILNATLVQHYQTLTRMCPECELPPAPVYPDVQCNSTSADATWRTNIVITGKEPDLDNKTRSALIAKLEKIQSDHMTLIGRFLDVTIITLSPPIISPIKDEAGLVVHLKTVTICPMKSMVYRVEDNSCIHPGQREE